MYRFGRIHLLQMSQLKCLRIYFYIKIILKHILWIIKYPWLHWLCKTGLIPVPWFKKYGINLQNNNNYIFFILENRPADILIHNYNPTSFFFKKCQFKTVYALLQYFWAMFSEYWYISKALECFLFDIFKTGNTFIS